MSDFDKFFNNDYDFEIILGTYLYPHRLLSEPDWNDRYSATEIINTAKVDDLEIYITINGGLFVTPPPELILEDPLDFSKFYNKQEFEEKVATAFNQLICEFSFFGLVSEPATPVQISIGKKINNHALITSGYGGREMYLDRTITPSIDLLSQNRWRTYPLVNPDIILKAICLERASILARINITIPVIIASAYSNFSKRQLGETIIDSWMVIEQLLNDYWKVHISKINDTSRKKRLKDHRTYSSSVKIEMLFSLGLFPNDLYEKINKARKHRNDLAHNVVISLDGAKESTVALQSMIEFFLKTKIEPLLVNEGINW